MTNSPENRPKLKSTPAERALGVRLVTSTNEEPGSTDLRADSVTLCSEPTGSASEASDFVANAASTCGGTTARRRFDQWYEIIEQLGSDTTTITYKALDISTNDPVCIKVLLPYFIEKTASEQIVQHRLTQAQALAHESILPVRGIGTNEEGQTYIVEDYREGISLRELSDKGEVLSPRIAVDIFAQVCEGLDYAHSRGVVHGSLRPDDIILFPAEDGSYVAQIRNFAVDALIPTRDEDVQRLTGCGVLLGADLAQYLSAEQCTGSAPDARSDIYALGCIMYEMLSGRKAVDCDSFVQSLARQISEIPPSFADFCYERQIPEPFEAVIFKCLEKRPDDRYQRAGQLKLALMLPQMVSGKPKSRVHTTDKAKYIDHDTSHMRRIAWISGGIVLLGLILATIFIWIPNHVQMPGDPEPSAEQPSDNPVVGDNSGETDEYTSALQKKISELTAALNKNPSDVNALLNRAQANYDAHDYNNALADLAQRNKLHPDRSNGDVDSKAAVKLRVETLLHANKIEDALIAARAMVADAPNDATALAVRSEAFLAGGHLAAALTDSTRAIKLGNKHAEAYVAKAAAENALGKYDLALSDAEFAEQLNPKVLQAYGESAKALTALGRYTEAETQCMKVFDSTTELAEPYVWLGECYAAQRRYDEALYEFGQASSIDGELLSAYVGAARAYMKLSRYDEAITEANKALALDAKSSSANALLGEVYKLTEPLKASNYFEKAAKYSKR